MDPNNVRFMEWPSTNKSEITWMLIKVYKKEGI